MPPRPRPRPAGRSDKNGDGRISVGAFEAGLRELGVSLEKEQLDAVMRVLDPSACGCVEYKAFVTEFRRAPHLNISDEGARVLAQHALVMRQQFELIDVRANGLVTRSNFRMVLEGVRARAGYR